MKRQSGQSMVLVALLLIAFVGLLAVTLDGGYAFLQRRNAQSAADAGALAGARELCITGDTTLATQAAIDYSITRNQAEEADVVINGDEVEVTARIRIDTFFGSVLGRPEIVASGVAAANCFAAGEAEGILPLAWNCPPTETFYDAEGDWHCDMQYGPADPYIIMNSRKIDAEDSYCISEGGAIDCDIDSDGEDELIAGGNRSWLDLDGSSSDSGGGSAQLVNWIRNGYPNSVSIHTFYGGQPGVSNNVFMAVEDIVDKTVLLPVYNAVFTGGPPPLPYDDPDDQVVTSNGLTTYYHVIAFSLFKVTCVHAKGGDSCPLYDQLRADGVLGPDDKTVEGYFVEGSVVGLSGQGDLIAGAYTTYLTR